MSRNVDYYKILHVEFGADKADIAAAYKKLCKIYHPDVSRNPNTEEIMKQINNAYAVLNDDVKREAYDRKYSAFFSSNKKQNGSAGFRGAAGWNPQRGRTYGKPDSDKQTNEKKAEEGNAFLTAQEYLSCLLTHDYKRAYELLSDYDRQYVTLKAFNDWKETTNRHRIIREFQIERYENANIRSFRAGLSGNIQAKKFNISITELNLQNQAVESRETICRLIMEKGVWRILLGPGELSGIAAVIENLSPNREKSEMERFWEQYCEDNCRQLDMLSLSGLLKKAEPELYRHSRYKQAIVIASFDIKPPPGAFSEKHMADVLQAISKSLKPSIRDCDIPAYIGNGIFIVLFCQLRRRGAKKIIHRLTEMIIRRVYLELRVRIDVKSRAVQYKGGPLRPYIEELKNVNENNVKDFRKNSKFKI